MFVNLMAEVIDMNCWRTMYFYIQKMDPSRIDTGFGDHHNIRSEIPSKHAMKKWHPKYTYNSCRVISSPEISLLVSGIKTPLTHCSGNAILKRDSSVISEIFGQLCSLHTPLVLRQFTSSLLGKMLVFPTDQWYGLLARSAERSKGLAHCRLPPWSPDDGVLQFLVRVLR